jgi:TetR/AcrR family transcriptional regulator, mexJK operon transcriptional repressor
MAPGSIGSRLNTLSTQNSDARMRPRSRRKHSQILSSAARLFREHGYGATSMDAVALAAGVSKVTIYAHFADKQTLFAAIVASEDAERTRSWSERFEAAGDVRARLLRLGRAVLDLLLAPETIATHRMVAAEATRFPEIGRAYYENGAARLLQRLEEIFSVAMAAGELRRAHPRRAAEQFVGLIRGDLQLRSMLGVEADVAQAAFDTVLRSGVDTFYRAYGLGGLNIRREP